MRWTLLALVMGFLILGCDEGSLQSQRPGPEEIEPCDCVPPPAKTLPEEKLNAAMSRLTGFAELMDVLTPESRGLEHQLSNEGLTAIVENCLLVHKKVEGEKKFEILDYIQTENRSDSICPVQYRTETKAIANPQKLSIKGRHKTRFRAESQEIANAIGLSNLVVNGPWFRRKTNSEVGERKLELLQTEFSQKGFAFFPDLGRINMKVIHQDSKEIFTDNEGFKSFGDISVNRFLVWELGDDIVVFNWRMMLAEGETEPVTQCQINGTDVTDSRLCRIF